MADVGEVRYTAAVDTGNINSSISKTESSIKQSFSGIDSGIKNTTSSIEKETAQSALAVSSAVTGTSKTADLAGNLIASGYAARISSSIFSAGASLAKFGMQFNSEMENYTTNFTTMLGSADKAVSFVDDLKNMAAKTPFGTSDLANASQTLLAFGVNAESIMPTMKMLGDVSLGNKDRFNSLALAFGQVSSAGKLSGQDLLQFINAGFNPLNEIAKTTGESMEELKQRMSEGGISAEEVAAAFESATSAGGQFNDGMAAASETTAGKISTLKDNASELAGTMMESLLPVITTLVDWLSNAAQWLTEHESLAKAIGIAILALVTIFGTLSAALSIATAASAAFGIAVNVAIWPITLIMVAIVALIAIGVALAANWDTIVAKCKEIWGAIADWFGSVWEKIKKGFSSLIDWFESIPEKFKQIGKNIVDGIWNGIKNGWDWLVNSVKDLAGKLLNGVKDFLGIHSPSKKFAYLGKMSGLGMEQGIDESFDDVNALMKDKSAKLIESAQLDITGTVPNAADLAQNVGLNFASQSGDKTINVPVYLNGREIARATAWDMGEQLAWEGR